MGVVDGLTRTRAALAALTGHGGRWAAAAAFLLYLALALAVTWPWILHPASTTFGVTYGDLGSHIGTPAAWAREGRIPWLPGTVTGLDAPEGRPVQWALNLAAAPSLTLLTGLAAAAGPVAANGIWVVAGFALSAWAMFLLARRITGRTDAALVAGLAFGFWPYAYSTVSQPLGHGWVLVVMVWRLLVLVERPTIRNGLWAGAATVLAMWWIQYWLLIAGVLWASLAGAGLWIAWRRGRLRPAVTAHAAAAAPVVALLAMLAIAGLSSHFDGVPDRGAGDQQRYSARAAMYLVPGPFNPIAGRWTDGYIERHYGLDSSDAVYNPIYVGLTVLALAVVGVVALLRARRRPDRGEPRGAIVACCVAGLVALVMSAPPRMDVLGVSVPMPAALIEAVTTAFRTSARFAHVVMLALCVLLAVGMAALLRRRRPAVAVLLAVAVGALVFADLWGRDPVLGSPTRTRTPAVLQQLAGLPPGIVATYPLKPSTSDRSGPVYAAVTHHHRVFNGYRQGTPSETRKLGLARLRLPWVPSELRAYGVRYVLVEVTEALGGRDELPLPGQAIPGLEVLGRDGYATLYRVTAPPAADMALARSGFSYIDGSGPTAYRFMTSRTGTLDLWSDCGGCRRELRLFAAAVNRPRALVVRDGTGRVLLRREVGLGSTALRVPVRMTAGRARISLTADPGPEPISPTDFRRAGILINVRMRLGAPPGTPDGPGLAAPPR